ncbi:MAG: hypothetical protein H6698_08185 [Myxococcales bacterium]|nr:hypothetical protein [Myxococcales bacterium]MCB9531142.1 hypothetical protein [Myxococcales bacterium]MCB9534267.1 hypothetical protein [Myxococcales bacterium]
MARVLSCLMAIALLAGCGGDDGYPLYDPTYSGGGQTTSCGTNAHDDGFGTCVCVTGYDWCSEDLSDTNCCAPAAETYGEIIVSYQGADDEGLQSIEDRLRPRGLFEAVASSYTNALAFPEDLYLMGGECGFVNALYTRANGSAAVLMCYDLYAFILNTFATRFEAADAQILADHTWAFVLLHELGHALIDIFDLPVVAAEEDAADSFSVVNLVAMGRADAAESAAAFWFLADDHQDLPEELADEHSLNRQRFYDILCLVYGSDPTTYASMGTQFPDMAGRLPRCEDEWESARTSWNELLAPHARP